MPLKGARVMQQIVPLRSAKQRESWYAIILDCITVDYSDPKASKLTSVPFVSNGMWF